MAIKKSDLYAKLWESCNKLRGGMEASEYKDYVLSILFIKYVSDKFANEERPEVIVPEGASFADLVALKGRKDIGEMINTQIKAPLEEANDLAFMPDFDDDQKLGSGNEKVSRLGSLIAIFEDKELDFSKNRADGDDILGDAYEFLMRHFASESGKSKGQFYTPAEVSRVMAKLIGIGNRPTTNSTTVYDPTCGSGSLLIKVADEASANVTLYGQEKYATTAGLAKMNMVLHNYPTADIKQGNTLTSPFWTEHGELKRFDYIVANPPFSDKAWTTGLNPFADSFKRFQYGVPPDKQGDFAYLLHIITSLKSTGIAACILPHGVLFRGNAEYAIRKELVTRGYIKAIVGLPANLFYGTGIPACIIVIDKNQLGQDRGIFMIDASQGCIKDGPKNRLRERDLHKIVDVYLTGAEIPGYSRYVPLAQLEANDFNLNLPRYIESQDSEPIQDLEAHLKGGLPLADINSFEDYWRVCPNLKNTLFRPLREGYLQLAVDKAMLKETITMDPEFVAFTQSITDHFNKWRLIYTDKLKGLTTANFTPKQLIKEISESLLRHFEHEPLIDPYAIYQSLMDYWQATMQDDAYTIAADGWVARPYRIYKEKANKKTGNTAEKYLGWACDLVPKDLLGRVYYSAEMDMIQQLKEEIETTEAQILGIEEEHSSDEGLFAEIERTTTARVSRLLKETNKSQKEDIAILNQWLELDEQHRELKARVKELEEELDEQLYSLYEFLTEDQVKELVVDEKWMPQLADFCQAEVSRISTNLTQGLRDLADRYETPLPALTNEVEALQTQVAQHLKLMGLEW